MNIAPIFLNVNYKNNQNTPKYKRTNNPLVVPKYNNQINSDTISFKAKMTTATGDFWTKQMPRLERIGTAFLDATDAVTSKLEEYGVSFVREMFESRVVKTVDSQLLKVLRHRTFERRDLIRTTIFEKNPYDLSVLFNHIISEYGVKGNRGYYIAPIMKSVGDLMTRGYMPLEEEKLVSEILENPLTKTNVNKTLKKLEKITYEFPFKPYTLDNGDISEAEQIRYNSFKVNRPKYNFDDTKRILLEFVKEGKIPTREDYINIVKSIKKEVPDVDVRLKSEILRKSFNKEILPENFKYCIGEPHGPYEDIQIRLIRDYDKASSTPIYHEIIVHFGPTYNVNAAIEHKIYETLRLFETLNIDTAAPSFNSPASRINGYIESIQKLIRRELSEQLLEYGKNVDYYGMDGELSIKIGDDVIEDYNKKFEWLLSELDNHYKAAKKAAKGSGTTYKILDKNHKSDKALVNKIKKDIDAIIEEFNHKYGLKDSK